MPEGFYFTVLSPKKKLYLFLHFQSPTSSLHGPANDTSYKKSDHTYNDDDNNIISKREKEKEKKNDGNNKAFYQTLGCMNYFSTFRCINAFPL